MIHALCPLLLQGQVANHRGRAFMSDVCDHSCVRPSSDFKVNTISTWHSPTKTPFLPLTVPALGQGLQILVVNS